MFHRDDKKPIKCTAKEIQELDALNYKNKEAFFERCGMPKPLNIDLKKLPSRTPIFMEKYE